MSLEHIIKIEDDRHLRQNELYNKIYGLVTDKINKYVQLGAKTCFYKVPQFIFGYPLINIEKTMDFLLRKLNHKGFVAFQQDHQTIYISWEISKVLRSELKKERAEKSKISLTEETNSLSEILTSMKMKTINKIDKR